MQRTVTRFHLHDAAGQRAAELAYWLAQPVQARIAAVEALRELQRAPSERALAVAAQTCSVSFSTELAPQVLAAALVSGVLPEDYHAHMGTLIDEAPLSVVVAAVEAAAAQGGVPAAKVWKHIGAWARAILSPRKVWNGF